MEKNMFYSIWGKFAQILLKIDFNLNKKYVYVYANYQKY